MRTPSILYFLSLASVELAAAVDERSVLLEFFQKSGGLSWNENAGWVDSGVDICEWHGVVCEEGGRRAQETEEEPGRVVGLKLPSNYVTGRTPASLWTLPALTSVDFSGNDNLDVSFVDLDEPDSAKLLSVKIRGTSTTSIAGLSGTSSTLELLEISDNLMESQIPPDLYELTQLVTLQASKCGFLGSIPDDIRQLSLLHELDLSKNDLTGTIPEGLSRLIHLRKLNIGFNQLHGGLPEYLNDFLLLQEFWVLDNDLTGTVPSFHQSPDIHKLYFNGNSLSGELPWNFLEATLNGMQQYQIHVNLSGNSLGGSIPDFIDNLESLDMVWILGDNEWTAVPEELCDNANWNQGSIAEYGCFGFLCPPETYNQHGFQTPDAACQPCASATFYGMTGCFDKDDRSALEELYVELQGEDWERNDNWRQSDNFCDWYGVECWNIEDEKNGRVRKIILPNNGLVGTVPEAMYSMHHLTTVDFSRNDIVLPFNSISESRHLFSINIAKTKTTDFDGIDGANEHLHELYVDSTPISGSIPSEIFGIQGLRVLSLNECNLSGELSPDLFNAVNLERLHLSDNDLQGIIPDRWDELEKLQVLTLAKNQFRGRMPSSFDSAASLTAVSLQDQVSKGGGMSGSMDPLATTTTIRTLHLAGNKLEGDLPENLLTSVEIDHPVVVDLSDNLITGTVHAAYSRFNRLDIYLQGNFISEVDDSLCGQSEWMSGTVSEYGCDAILCPSGTSGGRQRFVGTSCEPCGEAGEGTPSYLGQQSCGSSLSGDLSERDILELLYDRCGGSSWRAQESWMTEVSVCDWYGIECDENGSVISIHLGGNGLVGSIPSEVFMLPNLLHLKVYSNSIDFSFDGIENADNLLSLGLDNTGLSTLRGIGRARSLVEVNVASNRLNGAIPEEVSRLVNLRSFDISRNNINGYLPYWIRSLVSLTTLSASHNNLSGPVSDFATLTDLAYLDLSHNQLTGSIPATLFNGSTTDQKIIADFSFNSLSGELPASLSEFSKLSIQAVGNRITGVEDGLCEASGLNDFDVERFGCDGLLCPAGTWSPLGRQSTEGAPCRDCRKAKYMGSTHCSAASALRFGLWAVGAISTIFLAW